MARLEDIGIVVGPGGNNVNIGAGMFVTLIKFLRAQSSKPKYIQGVSGGGLIGCGYVGLRHLIRGLLGLGKRGTRGLFNRFEIPMRLFAESLFSNKGLRRIVETVEVDKILAIAHETEIEIVALNEGVDEGTEQSVFISNRLHQSELRKQPSLWWDYLEAGCCIPGFLPARRIDGGAKYSDGLMPSMSRAFRRGCKVVFFLSSDHPHKQRTIQWFWRWLSRWWVVRLRKPFDRLYNSALEHKLRVLVVSKKYPGVKIFALDTNTVIAKRVKDILSPLTPEAFVAAERCVILVTPGIPINNLSTLGFTEKSIHDGFRHGCARMKEMLQKLGLAK